MISTGLNLYYEKEGKKVFCEKKIKWLFIKLWHLTPNFTCLPAHPPTSQILNQKRNCCYDHQDFLVEYFLFL